MKYKIARKKQEEAEEKCGSKLPEYVKEYEIPILCEDGSCNDWVCRDDRHAC